MAKNVLPAQLEEATLIIEFRRASVDELDRLIARTLGDLAASFDTESLKLLNGEDGEADE